MKKILKAKNIDYKFFGNSLGGYRRGGYLNYMKSNNFKLGIKKLIEVAMNKRVAIMCLERNSRYCHRRYIESYLKDLGAEIIHIE